MFDVTALGELLIDFTPAGKSNQGNVLFEQNPGGAPANVLATLAKLGKKTSFIGKVGTDSFGTFLCQSLQDAGIETTGLKMTSEVSTTLAFVHLNNEGDRSFSFVRQPGADMMLTVQDITEALVCNSRIFHFGSISMTHESCAQATAIAVSLAKEAGALISFDPNLRIPLWENLDRAREMIRWGLMHADIVKISEEELTFITGEKDLAIGSKQIAEKYGNSIILVTLGERGCFVHSRDKQATVPGYQVKTMDTTGAGDAFLGGFIYQVLERDNQIENMSMVDLYSMVRFANAVGALVTTRKGAIPSMPSIAEIGELLS